MAIPRAIWVPQEDAWVTREVLGCQMGIDFPALGRCFCNSKEMLGCFQEGVWVP